MDGGDGCYSRNTQVDTDRREILCSHKRIVAEIIDR